MVHTYSKPGVYNVILKVNDDASGQTRANVTITVLDLTPIAKASFSPAEINSSETIYFSSEGSWDLEGPISYYWTFGDDNDSTDSSPDHTYTKSGAYTATLTVTDLWGQTDSVILTPILVMNQPPVAKFKTFGNFIEKNTVIFDASKSYDPDGFITYSWTFGDGKSSDIGPIADHVYLEQGNYSVILNVEDDNGHISSVQHVITITPLSMDIIPPDKNDTGPGDKKNNSSGEPTKPEKADGEEKEPWFAYASLILNIILIIILILILLFLIMRKKKEEGMEQPFPQPTQPESISPQPPPPVPVPKPRYAQPVEQDQIPPPSPQSETGQMIPSQEEIQSGAEEQVTSNVQSLNPPAQHGALPPAAPMAQPVPSSQPEQSSSESPESESSQIPATQSTENLE